MKWRDFGHGHAFLEVHIVAFIGQCAVCDLYTECTGEMSCYGTAFSMEHIVFLEDFTLQGCGDVLLSKHPVLHRLVVHSAWTPWS